MKKFIIAICGIILAGGAIGAKCNIDSTHFKRAKTCFDDTANLEACMKTYASWIPDTSSDYNTSLGTSLYKNLNQQLGKPTTDNHGTYGDEGAIVLIIARDIYEHGGNFCMTQIQAANDEDCQKYTWLDYYDYPDKYKCEVLCRDGFNGQTCSEQPSSNCLDSHNELIFGDDTQKKDGRNTDQITERVTVLSRINSENNNSDTKATHIVLAVVEQKDHGVIVSPVKIIGERYKDSSDKQLKTYIKSIQSNNQKTLLCAQDYKPNDNNTDCELIESCHGQYDKCEDEKRNFDSNKHEWKTRTMSGGKICRYIVCKSGYGLDNDNETCIPCATTRNQGIKDGVCVQCHDDEVFNNGNCDKYKQLSKHALLDGFYNIGKCWMKSNPSEYKNCVLCETSDQNYDDESKTCQ